MQNQAVVASSTEDQPVQQLLHPDPQLSLFTPQLPNQAAEWAWEVVDLWLPSLPVWLWALVQKSVTRLCAL